MRIARQVFLYLGRAVCLITTSTITTTMTTAEQQEKLCQPMLRQGTFSKEDTVAPTLEGPDSYHVYIGLGDPEVRRSIRDTLESKDFTCYEDDSGIAESDNILTGMGKSRNVLLLVGSSQNENNMKALEQHTAVERAKARGKGSVILILCGNGKLQVSSELKEFETLPYGNDRFVEMMFSALAQGNRDAY